MLINTRVEREVTQSQRLLVEAYLNKPSKESVISSFLECLAKADNRKLCLHILSTGEFLENLTFFGAVRVTELFKDASFTTAQLSTFLSLIENSISSGENTWQRPSLQNKTFQEEFSQFFLPESQLAVLPDYFCSDFAIQYELDDILLFPSKTLLQALRSQVEAEVDRLERGDDSMEIQDRALQNFVEQHLAETIPTLQLPAELSDLHREITAQLFHSKYNHLRNLKASIPDVENEVQVALPRLLKPAYRHDLPKLQTFVQEIEAKKRELNYSSDGRPLAALPHPDIFVQSQPWYCLTLGRDINITYVMKSEGLLEEYWINELEPKGI
jgi:hypothetical protein